MDTCLVRLLVILGVIIGTSGHSWIACTDYREENGAIYSHDKCRAFPRHGRYFTPRTVPFGLDLGYHRNRPCNEDPCRTKRNDTGAYDDNHPAAAYYPGQRVVIAHPTKNHVADARCNSIYIPDIANKVFVGSTSPNAAADPTLQGFFRNEVDDLGVSPWGKVAKYDDSPTGVTTKYPKRGYQNAPNFCQNQESALATNVFTVPKLAAGRYTFMWGWWFNTVDDLYITCWEADVMSSKQSRDNRLRARNQDISDLTAENPPPEVTTHPLSDKPPINMSPSSLPDYGDYANYEYFANNYINAHYANPLGSLSIKEQDEDVCSTCECKCDTNTAPRFKTCTVYAIVITALFLI